MSQPLEVYPNSNPNPVYRQPITSSSHTNGSFGPVFIVLAVIVVISAVACVLGRLCNRRHPRVKEAAHHHHHHHQPKPNKQPSNQGLGPKEWESRQKPPSFNMRESDVEFGFDKKLPSAKMPNNNDRGKVKPVQFYNAGHKPDVRFSDNV